MQKRGGINWSSREQLKRSLVIEFHNECLPLGGLYVIWNGYLKSSHVNGLGSCRFTFFWWALLIHTFIKMKGNLHRLIYSKMIERNEKRRGLFSSGDAIWQILCKDWAGANSENKSSLECRLPPSEAADPAGRYQSSGALFQNELRWVRSGEAGNTRGQDDNRYLKLVDIY